MYKFRAFKVYVWQRIHENHENKSLTKISGFTVIIFEE
jgi:hypothetical protein